MLRNRRRIYTSEVPYIDRKWLDIDTSQSIGKLIYKNQCFRFKMRAHALKGGGKWCSLLCGCGRGVHKLYFLNEHLACRRCHCLAYRSENRSKIERPIDQKWKYLRQLGSDDVYPEKPKWMKEHKFDKICQKINYYDRLAHLRFF